MRGKEFEPTSPDPFWSVDELLGEARFYDEEYTLRLKAHTSEEHIRAGQERHEIFPVLLVPGMRQYVLARPYVLKPHVSLTVDLFPQPDSSGAVGRASSVEWDGMRQVEVGSAQAWFYESRGTLILWECLLDERHRADAAANDPNLSALWDGFERFLLRRFPGTRHIVTPSWEPDYDRADWQSFLEAHQYAPVSDLAFAKEVARR